jgi:hypothetical protein
VRELLMSASLAMIAVLILAPGASAQGSFCTTTATASGVSVTRCVDAPSPSATATPEVTVQAGPPLSPSPTATASGTIFSSVSQAAGGRLPPTGGGLGLVAAALLLGSGVTSFVILRGSKERPR